MARNSSGQTILSDELSSGERILLQSFITLAKTLKAPIYDRRPLIVLGKSHEDNVDIRCLVADNCPLFHFQPRITVDVGQITVFSGDKHCSHLCSAVRTAHYISRSSSRLFAPQYRSSAILATLPSNIKSPNNRVISSSRVVSEPGNPIQPANHGKVKLHHNISSTFLLEVFDNMLSLNPF